MFLPIEQDEARAGDGRDEEGEELGLDEFVGALEYLGNGLVGSESKALAVQDA